MNASTCLKENNVSSLFAEHGLRFTRQRHAVYDALSSTKSHPTADELYRTVSQTDQGISLATVYNTLEAFCNCGLAQKLATNGSSARYDAAMHNHLHLRDNRSGEMCDVPDDLSQSLLNQLPRSLIEQIESRLGFKVSQIRIELVGEKKGV